MSPMRWIEDIARRRLPDDERIRHDAFLDEIGTHSPVALQDLGARLVHLRTTAQSGPVTLAQVGASGYVAALGASILMMAGTPRTPHYDSNPAMWSEPLMSLGLLLLAVECLRHPLRIRRSATAVTAFVLLTAGCLGGAVTAASPVRVADDLLVAAIGLIGVGAGITVVGFASTRETPVAIGLKVAGVGGFGVFLADGAWAAIFMADDDAVHALGSFASAAGALIMANGLIASRPEIRLRPAH